MTYIGLRSDIRAETCGNYEYVKKTNMYVHCLKETGGLGVQPRRKRKNTGFYYGAQSMRTTLIVITAFIVVPFLFRIVRKKSVRLCQKLGSPNLSFHTRLFKKNRFRKFVSETTDLWIERGLV